MFIGHYSAGLVAKAVDPRIPLGALFVATQIVDIVWCILVMTGIEETLMVRMKMNHAVSPLDNPNKIVETRRNIARLKTEVRTRQIQEQSAK